MGRTAHEGGGGERRYGRRVSDPSGPPSPHIGPPADVASVLAANEEFYAAFEAADLDAMSDLWAHDDRVSCVHPGWSPLRGWGAVAGGWAALFGGPERLQFILTGTRCVVEGDLAWVTGQEDILGPRAASVASLNLFHRGDDGSWRMVAHHGTAVADRTGPS